MRKEVFCVAALFAVFVFSCGDQSRTENQRDSAGWSKDPSFDWIELTGNSSWQADRGDWKRVGSVSTDPGDDSRFVLGEGEEIWVNGSEGTTVDLHSIIPHQDVELHIEFMVPRGSNSGVYLQSRYEVQIFDSWQVDPPTFSDCGGIYQRWKDGKGFEGHAPLKNVSRPPGDWQSFDILFRAPRFDAEGFKTENARFIQVRHNGEVIHEDVEVTGPTRAASFQDEVSSGVLMIQGDHGPVAIKNVRLREAELD